LLYKPRLAQIPAAERTSDPHVLFQARPVSVLAFRHQPHLPVIVETQQVALSRHMKENLLFAKHGVQFILAIEVGGK
jgi:hypothetical protein